MSKRGGSSFKEIRSTGLFTNLLGSAALRTCSQYPFLTWSDYCVNRIIWKENLTGNNTVAYQYWCNICLADLARITNGEYLSVAL